MNKQKILMRGYYLATKNKKESEMCEWLCGECDDTLLVGHDAFDVFLQQIISKAEELDAKYPRTKPMRITSVAPGDWTISISVADFGRLNGTIVRHEIETI